VSQLKSWNGLKSTRIDIGDQLIVGQKKVLLPAKANEVEYSRVETSGGGSNIISTYLKEQIGETDEGQLPEEAEGKAEEE